jgi:hypothetical protein
MMRHCDHDDDDVAQKIILLLRFIYLTKQFFSGLHVIEKRQLVTCPGFPGYCSESYPGGVCTVVCAFGRPNVPNCQVST